MLTLFLLAACLTVLLGIIFIAGLIAGAVMAFIPSTRRVAPFVFFIPTGGALGAASGAWGGAWWIHEAFRGMQEGWAQAAPFWAWVFGFLFGGGLGGLLGFGLAWRFRKRCRADWGITTEDTEDVPEEGEAGTRAAPASVKPSAPSVVQRLMPPAAAPPPSASGCPPAPRSSG